MSISLQTLINIPHDLQVRQSFFAWPSCDSISNSSILRTILLTPIHPIVCLQGFFQPMKLISAAPTYAITNMLRHTSVALPHGLCGVWWRIGRVDVFRPEDRGFESSCHIETLGKSFTYSCL